MLKRIILIIYFCLTLTIPAYSDPICKVIDGDTFHFCNGTKVRLDSIDAPEKKEPFYWESRRALAELLQTRNIRVEGCRTDETGKRQACQVYADDKDVQAELVRMGMAWDWPKYSSKRYMQLEKEAKTQRRGFWVNPESENIHWSQRSRN